MEGIPDKVTVGGHYDETGRCRRILVYINTPVITPDDIAVAVRAVFRADPGVTVTGNSAYPPATTHSGRSAVDTTVTNLRITDHPETDRTSRKWF